jgi:putative nucleotidyltransferase with HDIG domain
MGNVKTAAAAAKDDPLVSEERPLRELIEEEITSGRAAPQVMPEIAMRVREVTGKENYALRELTKVIEREPSLVARVLHCANSAAYAGLREVTDLHQAVTRLGATMVESVAVAAATRELYQASSREEQQDMQTLWKHSVATAEAGRLLAQEVPSASAEEVFLTCLLHDVGRVVILRALKSIEKKRQVTLGDGVRQEILESLHAECGARLLESWSVPEVIREAVLYHHEPERAPQGRDLAHIVCLANNMCHKLGYSLSPDPSISLLSLPSVSVLKLDDMVLASLLVAMEDLVRESPWLS